MIVISSKRSAEESKARARARDEQLIEQDADIVSFIFRPEYYGMTEWDDDEHTPCEGQGEFIVAKHRNGGLNNIKLKFISNLGKFDNLDNFETPFEYQSKINKDIYPLIHNF